MVKIKLVILVFAAILILLGCNKSSKTSMDAEAKEIYTAAMKQDPAAAYALAKRYRKGEGVKQDLQEALKWYEKAAEQGVAEAQLDLAIIYEGGQIVPRDYGLAMRWYLQAAMQGSAIAKIILCDFPNGYDLLDKAEGVTEKHLDFFGDLVVFGSESGCYFDDEIEQHAQYIEGAKLGSAHAQYSLANQYKDIFNKLNISQRKAYEEAFKWMKKSAEQNNPEAQKALGYFYVSGLGTPINYIEAVMWYGKSADQVFDVKLYIELAKMYSLGRGVEKNNLVAYALINYIDAKGYGYEISNVYIETFPGMEETKAEAFMIKQVSGAFLNSREVEKAQALSTKMYDSGNITETIKQFLAGN